MHNGPGPRDRSRSGGHHPANLPVVYRRRLPSPLMADRLNAMGAPPPRGPRWTRHHLQRMLQNERYRGRAIWGQQVFERRPGTNQKVARRRPRDRWHVVDRPELRIVDDDLWQRAQARRASVRASLKLDAVTGRARGRTGLYSKHLLVGLSQCGVCGKGFTVISSRHGSPRYGCHQSWHNGLTACANRLTVMAKVADPADPSGLRLHGRTARVARMVADDHRCPPSCSTLERVKKTLIGTAATRVAPSIEPRLRRAKRVPDGAVAIEAGPRLARTVPMEEDVSAGESPVVRSQDAAYALRTQEASPGECQLPDGLCRHDQLPRRLAERRSTRRYPHHPHVVSWTMVVDLHAIGRCPLWPSGSTLRRGRLSR